MHNTKPFQKHQPDNPAGAKIASFYRRNIIVSHPDKKIYVQVMWDGLGEFNLQEWKEINSGAWFNFVPKELITTIREGINSGYKVQTMALAGGPVGEMHTVLQVIDITDGHHYFNNVTGAVEAN